MPDYFESGFCVRERSWHGKEVLLAEHPESWDEARMAAGLMWEPRLAPLYRRTNDGEYTEITAKVVERDDTGDELAVVSGTFELITHAEMGEIMETILAEPNLKFETAGSVKGGRQVYALVLLDEPYQIIGDVDGNGAPVLTLPYFAVLNAHDGSGACKGVYTQVRVVCANTYQAADMDGNRHGAQFSLRHTAGVKVRLEEARAVVAGARAEAERWREMSAALFRMPVTPEAELHFLNEFIPEPEANIYSERVRANIARERAKFTGLLHSVTNERLAGTALGLVNASVEYLDHARPFLNAQSYMGRQILRPEPMKARAIRLVRELVPA